MKFVEEKKEKNSEYKRNVPAGGLKKHSHVVAGGVAAAAYPVLNRNVRIRMDVFRRMNYAPCID